MFWTFLKAKYSKTSASTANTYMTRLQTFEFDKGKGIDHAWETLKGYRRKLVAADTDMKDSFRDKAEFDLDQGTPIFSVR